MANESILTFPLKALGIFNKRDKRALILFMVLQFLLSVLDLLAVLLLTFSVALLQSSKSLSLYQVKILSFLSLTTGSAESNSKIGFFLIVVAMSIMIIKTISTMLISKKVLVFLGKKSAETVVTNLERMLTKPELVLDQPSSQSTLFSITRGVELLIVQVIGTFILLISDIFLFIILLASVIFVDPSFGFPLVAMFLFIGLFLHVKTNNRAIRLGSTHTHLNIRSAELITEILSNFRVIYVRNRQSQYLKGISTIRNQMINVTASMNYLPYFTKFVLESGIILVSGLMGLIAFLSVDKLSAVNTMILVLAAASRIAPAAARIQQGLLTIKSTEGQARDSYQLLNQLSEISIHQFTDVNLLINNNSKPQEYRITANNLCFSYSAKQDSVFNDVNFEIPQGKVVALVGETGAGKSTLADLILGIRIPTSGEVLIGGRLPRDVINSNARMSYVPQEVKLTKGSIREYLSLGDDVIRPDAELIWALQTASFSLEKENYSELLNYEISEAGENFSGGQNQRLALAKALLPKPMLIILDEITNAQDQIKEYEMLTNLKNNLVDTTIILISHSNQINLFVDFLLEIEQKKITVKSPRS